MSDTSFDNTTKQTSHHAMTDQAREAANRVAAGALEMGQEAAHHYVKEPAQDLLSLAKSYAKDNPDVAACWAFGLGVLVGWKLKP